MAGRIRNFLPVLLLLPVAWNAGCSCGSGQLPVSDDAASSSSSSSSSGTGGNDLGPCGQDCSAIETPQCAVAVCNTGQEFGPLFTCVVVPAPKGTGCDDGQFCTVNDVCDNGTCTGGGQNTCGVKFSPCEAVICYEETKSCDVTPVNDGTPCDPSDLCQTNGVCKIGECVGKPKDCSFSPLNECNKVSCNPATGKCEGVPDPTKDDAPCVLTGDLCSTEKTCKAGQCGGGKPKNCSALNVECEIGECNPANGVCQQVPAPMGTACTEGVPECNVGKCDPTGQCVPSSAPDGVACNDSNACTQADKCKSSVCSGVPISGCQLYLNEGFETCPNGWTFGGDWECGTPMNVGPPAAHTGDGVIATQVDALYSVNQSFNACVADSPTIDLTAATNPVVSFWAWVHSEGGSFDGWNLKISTNGGQSFTDITTVDPPYDLTIAGLPAWGGNHSAEGWKRYSADLTAYAGQSAILRFAFRSDGATIFPGVYIDDVVVSEPQENPLLVTTSSPLPDVYTGMAYSAQIAKTGGTNNSVWSIKPGGANSNWLSIDPATGVLGGTPAPANVGPVSVTVHVEEPLLPSNFAEKTFTFTVKPAAYYTSFEGACPDGWTLTGDWQCGVPMNVGPAAAYVGTQCIGTQIAGNYNDLQAWDGTTATSPDIDLTNVQSPIVTFRMWIDTEGSTYDGANLQVSSDGGMSYTIISNVMPVYPLTVGGKPAWGGHQQALGWQFMQGDLSGYAGQIIRLRFAFRSDSSGVFPGVYIDDILVN